MNLIESVNSAIANGLPVTVTRSLDEGRWSYWLHVDAIYLTDLPEFVGIAFVEQMERTSPNAWVASKQLILNPQARVLYAQRLGYLVRMDYVCCGWEIQIGEAPSFEVSDLTAEDLLETCIVEEVGGPDSTEVLLTEDRESEFC
jgi:hypothetical protein